MSLVEQQDLPLLTTTSGVILSHVHDAPGWTKARQEEKDRAEKAKEKAAAKPKTKAKRGTTATGASATATGASSSAPGRKRKANPPVDAAEEGAAAKKARLESPPPAASSSTSAPTTQLRFRFRSQGDPTPFFRGEFVHGVADQTEAESHLEFLDDARQRWRPLPNTKTGCKFEGEEWQKFEKHAVRLGFSFE